MTAKEVLNLNGDFRQSPLLDTLHRMDSYLSSNKISYAVVGGMAVVRNGAHRTTIDLDILLAKDDWDRISDNPPEFLEISGDSAKDRINQVDIDILHPGDKWKMEIELPGPDEIGERDEALGGVFAGLLPLLTIKCAVYRKKLKEDGIEIAAKDLYDLTELLKARGSELTDADFGTMPPAIATALKDIRKKVC
jgi:hypothetical protein